MSIKRTHELKALQSEQQRAEAELEILSDTMKTASRNYNRQQTVVENIKYKIKSMAKKELVVSEHAILRYLERTDLINIKAVREAILTDSVKLAYSQLGNGKYPIEGELRAIIKSDVVVSVA